jgi:tRNA dimethylallyltransferase
MASKSPPAPPDIVAIYGPTASGKSAVAGILRERLDAEVVSADSAALFAGLPILTAAPAYPARLVGIVPLSEDISVGRYQRLAHAAIDEIVAAGRVAIVVGGTGLYLRAALSSLELPPPPAPGERERWEGEYDRLGGHGAHALLAERDPAAAARVHANDWRRVVRALELAEAGESLSGDALWRFEPRHPTLIVGLDPPKEELERRIVERTRAMFAAGVQEEVRAALAAPISRTARKTLGLDEVAELPRDEAIEAIVVRTRRYAAYQRKWMRRIPGLVIVESADDVVALARARERVPRR